MKKLPPFTEYGSAPESTDDAMAWIYHLNTHRHGQLFIGGEWVASQSEKFLFNTNPADESNLGKTPIANKEDIDNAYQKACTAQEGWHKLGGYGRAKYLYALARQIQKKSRLFSVLETLDNGKPIRESRDIDIPLVVRHFYYHAGAAQWIDNEYRDCQPWGVVAQIIPWNFPLLMLAWKIAPALATGNTVVLKPAEQTSLTALLFAETCEEVGLPPGVVNIITGDSETGKALIDHPGFDKYAFTGSTSVGREIAHSLAGRGKPLTLELGGKSPIIVFEKADLDSAVEGVVDSIWFNQGQVCCAGSRLLLQESIADRLLRKLKRKLTTLRIGHPLEKNIDMGPIISQLQRNRIKNLVADGIEDGGEAFTATCSLPKKGFYYPPTLIHNPSTSSPAFTEEIFGPVLVSTTFRYFEEAILLANNTRYGLSASVWSEDINQALGIAPELRAGLVWINSSNLFDASCEFGGVKETGYGREGGPKGLEAYMRFVIPPTVGQAKQTAKQNISPTSKIEMKGELTAEKISPLIDQTPKLYIEGKQVRPDGGHSIPVKNPSGDIIGWVGRGNRKDIRNAVEAANKNTSWTKSSVSLRSQILYFLAENLEKRKLEFAYRITEVEGLPIKSAQNQVETAIKKIFSFAGWANLYEGRIHRPPMRGLALSVIEPVGVIGIIAPDTETFLGTVTLITAALSLGNQVVVVTPEKNPLVITDFYQVLETSDIPDGVVNIITGYPREVVTDLAGHYQVDGIWCWGDEDIVKTVEQTACGNLKRIFPQSARVHGWDSPALEKILLQEASETKTIWIPYGE